MMKIIIIIIGALAVPALIQSFVIINRALEKIRKSIGKLETASL